MRWQGNWLLLLSLLLPSMIMAGDAEDLLKRTAVLKAKVAALSDSQAISIGNRRVLVSTPAIAEQVKGGPARLKPLIQVMSDRETPFDTFVRCYSACEQILMAKDPTLQVFWSGGARTKLVAGETRLFPFGQGSDRPFRRRVIKDVQRLMAIHKSLLARKAVE